MKTPYQHAKVCRELCESLRYFDKGRSLSRQVFFHAPNSDELVSVSQRLSEINYPIMVAIEGCDSDLLDTASDQQWKNTEYFIMLLDFALDTDAEAIISVQSQCDSVAMEIQRYMYRSARDPQSPFATLCYEEPITIRGIGPVGESLYGVVLKYNIEETVPSCPNPQMWHDNPTSNLIKPQ